MELFKRITLQTPESVELEFTLAGIGNRAYASLIDSLIIGLSLIFLLIIWAILYLSIPFFNSKTGSLWLYAVQILLIFALSVGYFACFETLWQGQTPGKKSIKIRVIRDDGRPIGLPQATLRALFLPLDQVLFIGATLIMFTPQEKRLGDWVAGTVVIQEEKTIKESHLISEEAQKLAPQLQKMTDLSQLLPEDFAAIRYYLQRREEMILEARYEVSNQLAQQIQEIIHLDNLPKGISANLFLEAIYFAYRQQFSQEKT